MLRTTTPPEGIAHVWNALVLESNRTSVFGFTFDSLYQITSPTVAMPYGSEPAPLGDSHSSVFLVAGSYRPR